MRKWMRDRLKRKKPEAGKGAPAPAPLQPAYFDAAPGAAAPVEGNEQEPEALRPMTWRTPRKSSVGSAFPNVI